MEPAVVFLQVQILEKKHRFTEFFKFPSFSGSLQGVITPMEVVNDDEFPGIF